MTPCQSRSLVTGFTSFGRFAVNPSALLAEGCGRPHRLIEVAYEAVDATLAALNPAGFDRLLMLGVAGESDGFRLETAGRNLAGPHADVRGVVPQGPAYDPAAPFVLNATLWPPSRRLRPRLARTGVPCRFSTDAGTYLCNYGLFMALRRFRDKRVGFLHVPPLDRIPLDRQRAFLAALLDAIEADDTASRP